MPREAVAWRCLGRHLHETESAALVCEAKAAMVRACVDEGLSNPSDATLDCILRRPEQTVAALSALIAARERTRER